MESQQVLESFDSLWFFATVFSNRAPSPQSVEKLQGPTRKDSVEPPGEEIATPIFQNQENVESNIVDEKTIDQGGGGLGSEIRTEEKEEKRRKSRRRRSSCFGQRRKVAGEMDLSYAVKEICECWLFKERIGSGNYIQMKKKKMPPFEDSMAMKEHIRSWAYAVACTVR